MTADLPESRSQGLPSCQLQWENTTGKNAEQQVRIQYKSCQYAYENDSEQRETYFFLFEIIANRIVPVTGLFLWLEALNITRHLSSPEHFITGTY